MRVLFVSNYPHLPDTHGGLQTTTHDLCLAIKELGAEAAVLCGQLQSGDCNSPEVCDEQLGYLVMRADDPAKALAMAAAAWNASIIVVQSGTALLPMVISSLATGRPTAVYLHNVEVHQLAGTLVSDPSLLYLANSRFTAERWRALSGIDCCIVPPVVAPECYLADNAGDKVLFVNPSPIKGIEILFSLAANCPDIPFLVGESWNLDPGWREHCLNRAYALGNIEWRAPTRDMRTFYAQGRMLLMPSVWEESFGRTVLEAQLNGLPVLASNRGALPDLVGNGGLTLDPHAPVEEWVLALRRLYASPQPFADNGRQQAMTHVASTPLIVGRMLTELALHASSRPSVRLS